MGRDHGPTAVAGVPTLRNACSNADSEPVWLGGEVCSRASSSIVLTWSQVLPMTSAPRGAFFSHYL